MVTWVHFRERSSGREFYFWNTHLDHEVEVARQKSATLIRERIAELKTDLPVVLTGDFNCAAGPSRAYEMLVKEGSFTDTWTAAKTRANESFNSFHGFQEPKKNAIRIDWILTRRAATVERAEIVTFAEAGQYPSDHFPVAAWLTFP
jgi:endonuclease/exonuclease/phosphatase family metal-dependent hydrolase